MKLSLLIPLTILCSVSVADAQTFNIERVYKHMVTANGGTQARQGVFANDKFYIHNWMDKTVEVWNQEGEMIETFESKGTGPAITADDAGNVVIENTDNPWPESSGKTRYYRIFKNGKNDVLDISVTYDGIRETTSGVRSDYLGPIEGDIMSEEGGTIVSMVQHRPVVNIAKIAKGEVVDNRSFWVDTAYAGGNIVCNMGYGESRLRSNWNTYVKNGAAYSQVNCFKYGDEYLVSKNMVGLKGFKYDPESLGSHPIESNAYRGILVNDHTTVYDPFFTAGDPIDSPNMSGDRLFTMGGKLYVIKHIVHYGEGQGSNSFAISEDISGKIVGLWHAFTNADYDRAGTACASWFKVIPIDDNKAEIYQYFPADGAGRAFIAKYIFTAPK